MIDSTSQWQQQRRYQRAETYLAQGDLAAAKAGFEDILGIRPAYRPALLNLLRIAQLQGRYRDGHGFANALSGADSDATDARLASAQMLARYGESRAALDALQGIVIEKCTDMRLLERSAQLAILLADIPLAGHFLDRSSALGRESVSTHYQQGVLSVFLGDNERAEAEFECCLQLSPGFGQAHRSLSRLRCQTVGSNHVDRLRKCLGEASRDADIVSIAFALFKELDDLGEHADAWQALSLGCEKKRNSLDYRWHDDLVAFERLERFALEGFFSKTVSMDTTGPRPIFIVGLPRSGSTLLERLLGSHPDIAAAGELPDFSMQLQWQANRQTRSYLDAVLFDGVASTRCEGLGARYLEKTQWRAEGRKYYTDKMPLNFINMGFILKSLPGATIIHIRKDPMDACFSNFKELFTGMYPHTYRLDELANYHEHYSAFMQRMKAVIPDATRLLELRYEDLVSAPGLVMKHILEALALPWCDACADTGGSSDTVTTASAVQVREKMHSRAVGQWRRYAQWLAPLQDRIDSK